MRRFSIKINQPRRPRRRARRLRPAVAPSIANVGPPLRPTTTRTPWTSRPSKVSARTRRKPRTCARGNVAHASERAFVAKRAGRSPVCRATVHFRFREKRIFRSGGASSFKILLGAWLPRRIPEISGVPKNTRVEAASLPRGPRIIRRTGGSRSADDSRSPRQCSVYRSPSARRQQHLSYG